VQLRDLVDQAEKALRSCYIALTPSSSERLPVRPARACSKSPEISLLADTVKGFRKSAQPQQL